MSVPFHYLMTMSLHKPVSTLCSQVSGSSGYLYVQYTCVVHVYYDYCVYIVHNIVQAASLLLHVLKKDYNLLQHISNIQVQVNNMI